MIKTTKNNKCSDFILSESYQRMRSFLQICFLLLRISTVSITPETLSPIVSIQFQNPNFETPISKPQFQNPNFSPPNLTSKVSQPITHSFIPRKPHIPSTPQMSNKYPPPITTWIRAKQIKRN